MAIVQFKDLNLAAVGDSKYQGTKNALARMVGFDIHSVPGLVKVNQKMAKNSGIVIDEYCMEPLEASNGIRYWASSVSGKVWQEKAGTYTLVHTIVPTANGAAITGIKEYQGYIYLATEKYLHRIATASADGAAAWTANIASNWATFTNASLYHPMVEINMVLYIADKYYVAQVDTNTFSANALDISNNYVITALGKMSTYLLIGGSIPNVNLSEIFSWNTYSTTFQSSDTVPERTINSFIEADNYVYVNAGSTGSVYAYNGSQLQFYKRIPGTYSSTKTCKINPNATGIYKGSIPIFGVSNVSGDSCDEGIWSLGRYSLNYPVVFNMEFPTSNVDADGYNVLTGIEIGAILVSGVDIYASWKRSSTITTTIADPAVVTLAAHGLTDGEAVYFTTTGALPTGITASTVYYAKGVNANTFNLYDTSAHAVSGGATGRVATTGTQSGVHTMVTVGVDKLDYSNKIVHPFMETRVIAPDRTSLQTFSKIIANYEDMPTGTSIVLKTKANHAASYSDTTEIQDTDRKFTYTDGDRIEAKSLQVRVECVASGNDAPTIEEIDVLLS